MKKLGIVALVIGIVFIICSLYIQSQVDDGRRQVKGAQEKVDAGSGLFSVTPLTKDIGKGIASPIQKEIDAGKMQIEQYQRIANLLIVGGIILSVVGIGALIVRKKR